MRRWLLIALLFMLPLQFTWAAAAAYCGHERAPAQTHAGHHAHEHKGSGASEARQVGDAAKDIAKAGKLVADSDCGYCHLSLAKPLLPLGLQLALDADFALDMGASATFDSRGPDHPDRPNWRLA